MPKAKNKKMRAQQLEARERKLDRFKQHQFNTQKAISKEMEAEQHRMHLKQKVKEEQKNRIEEEKITGKISEGPKLSKQRYRYREYLPMKDELGKPMSKVGYSEDLLKERFDTFFRKGMM